MEKERFKALLEAYERGRCTPEEKAYVESWFLKAGRNAPLLDAQPDYDRIDAGLRSRLALEPEGEEAPTKVRWVRKWLPYAAAVAVLLSVGWLLLVDSRQLSVLPTGQAGDSVAATEILPGGNRATLTLADGRIMNLDEAQTGIVVGAEDITYDDGTALEAVILSGEGEVSRGGVEGSLPNSGDASVMLALTTPKGGTYQVTLPDGSKVWLNSASTLKYPSRFSGDSREVILEGEAYFEIKKIQGTRDTRAPAALELDAGSHASSPAGARVSRVPFKVVTNGQTVEVLGTQFNISAYTDEDVSKTTLVEGKVKVTPGTEKGLTTHDSRLMTHVLTPGEQSIVRARLPGQGAQIETMKVDTEQFTAWKDGKIALEGRTLAEIMKEVSRWYDIEVVYQGDIPQGTFFGRANRSSHLGTVLRLLESAHVGYRLEGRTLIITNEEGGKRN